MAKDPAHEPPSPEELARREAWFHDYTARLDAQPSDLPLRCPCCFCKTLGGRGHFEICAVCFWEDDGQDDYDADVVRGGPNGALSLAEAHANYRQLGAGDTMYHTHINDLEQLSSGLYGPIVVLEPGERFDPSRDHLFVVGVDGAGEPHIVLNGDSGPPPLEFAAGATHRLRFINIGRAARGQFTLRRDTTTVHWRALAFHGAGLPPPQATARPATVQLSVGQTADFLFESPEPGVYRDEAQAHAAASS